MAQDHLFSGGIPENYDAGLAPHIFIDYAENLARRCAAFAPSDILELAAGTGAATRKLADASPGARILATDISEGMLEYAKPKFTDRDAVSFQTADAMALPFADASFDVIACQFGVMFFPDKTASYREALRILRPGGAYVFNSWGPIEANPFAEIAYETGARFFTGEPPGFYRIPFGYYDAAVVQGELAAAGFADVRHEVVRLEKEVRDWTLFAQGLVYGNPLIDEIRAHGGIDADEVKAAVVTQLTNRFGPAPGVMPLEATVYTAVKAGG